MLTNSTESTHSNREWRGAALRTEKTREKSSEQRRYESRTDDNRKRRWRGSRQRKPLHFLFFFFLLFSLGSLLCLARFLLFSLSFDSSCPFFSFPFILSFQTLLFSLLAFPLIRSFSHFSLVAPSFNRSDWSDQSSDWHRCQLLVFETGCAQPTSQNKIVRNFSLQCSLSLCRSVAAKKQHSCHFSSSSTL